MPWHGERDTARTEKHSVRLAGHRTSVTLEAPFWNELRRLAEAEGIPLSALIERIDTERAGALSACLRVYVLEQAMLGR
jgi:predicted DNA-binding ribbon-helix-helix protein